MDDEFQKQILGRLDELTARLTLLERNQELLANAHRRGVFRKTLLRPPMWTFEQHAPRQLDMSAFPPPPSLPAQAPRIAIVTPSFNHAKYLSATIDSILDQNYPNLHYHVQDGASVDGTLELLQSRSDSIGWRSERDDGQSHAINIGFAGVDCDIMAYLNSDDVLLPG